MFKREEAPIGKVEKATWVLWYQDTFDRETPRQIEAEGEGLKSGLIELWARHLRETVQPDGKKGFSHFNLWWVEQGKSISIEGEWNGQVRLREWVYVKQPENGHTDIKKIDLLKKVAQVHENQLQQERGSEMILSIAKTARDQKEFENQLDKIAQRYG